MSLTSRITTLLIFISSTTFAQITVNNADSVHLGEPAINGSIGLYGKIFLKNILIGNANDSILVRNASGQLRFVNQSVFARKGTINLALGTRTATTIPITNSSGTGFVLPIATNALAGMMSSVDKAKLDGIATGATANTGTVTNVSSTNTYITVATGTTTPALTLNAGSNANQVVVRDGAGNIAASVFSGNLVGNASTATTAANSTLWNNYSHDMNTNVGTSLATTGYILGVPSGTGLISKHNQASIRAFLGLGANAYSSVGYLPLTGGTLTGALSGSTGSFYGAVTSGSNFIVSAAAGSNRGLSIQTAPSSTRWYAYADNSPETGANAGSNFLISRYNDAGAFLGTSLTLNRATGAATFGSTLQAGLTKIVGGGNLLTLQSGSETGNSYIEFLNNAGVRNSYIGHGSTTTNDLFYVLPTASVHRFYTTALQRLGISDSRVTAEIPLRVNKAGNQFQYVQLAQEDGMTMVLSKHEQSTFYPQMSFVQGNNTDNREMARFNNDGNLVLNQKIGVGKSPIANLDVLGTGTFTGTVTAPAFTGGLTGNATSATALQTPRTLWGQNFNGTANVSGALTGVTTIAATGAVSATTMIMANNTNYASSPFALVGKNSGTDNTLYTYSPDGVKAMLGLGSNAYSSAAYLPLTGGTLTGQLIGTAGVFNTSLVGQSVRSNSNFSILNSGGAAQKVMDYTELTYNRASLNLYSQYGNNTPVLGMTLTGTIIPDAVFTGNIAAKQGTFTAAGGAARLQGTTATGNVYMEFLNTTGTRLSYIGHGTSATNDLYYTLPTNNAHRFLTSNIQRLGISDARVTTEIPLRINRSNNSLHYTQIDHEAGATTVLGKNGESAVYPQILFVQGNNADDREMARFNNDGNLVTTQKIGVGKSPIANLDVLGTGAFTGTVTAPAFTGGLTGNATSATTLQTPRLINGVSFNGSSDITIPATTNQLVGNNYVTGGTELPNFFGSGKLRLQMLSGTAAGMGTWMDALWMSSYTGTDVKLGNQLLFSKSAIGKIGFRQQNYDATAWGQVYEIFHTGNFNPATYTTKTYVDGAIAALPAATLANTPSTVPLRNTSGKLEGAAPTAAAELVNLGTLENYAASGTYIPTSTGLLGLSSLAVKKAFYTTVGPAKIVTVTGHITAQSVAISAGGLMTFRLSIPLPASFAYSEDLSGVASILASNNTTISGTVSANSPTEATFTFYNPLALTAGQTLYIKYSFTYQLP
ncbi:hypothetical protein PBAL39_13417 [Pedobacter sp. BAL39]|uniref:beta strand repeat-containing protein n=1 Tax=Pedobacter sp. BAL39 TaxID=391596 RepID=UPI0001559A49|nr:hypothetical protein [Pedobacter sp. BAL39]EDM35234.1 hypothetical protein PBAL39_13417 [Pedobacter sp. BAL39]